MGNARLVLSEPTHGLEREWNSIVHPIMRTASRPRHHLFQSSNYGVVDRYDLVPTSFSQDFNSEVGSSSFSDEMYPPRREYHSDYAGDLIFSTRTQSQSSYDSSSFTFGLGLSGITQSTGIHPMQLHTPALPGIDEIELTGISLTDQPDSLPMEDSLLPPDIAMSPEPKDVDGSSFLLEQRFSLDDLVDLSRELHTTPPGTPQTRSRQRSTVNQLGSMDGRYPYHRLSA